MLHDTLLHAASDDDALLLALHLHHPNWCCRPSVIHLLFLSNCAAHQKTPGAAPAAAPEASTEV
jgi:hypothetical protein